MKTKILVPIIAFLLIASVNAFAQQDSSAYTLEGKWNQCAVELKKSKLKFDTSYTCPGEWDYDIKMDGTYVENYVEECSGVNFKGHGTWTKIGQLLSLNSIVSDCAVQVDPLEIEMKWLTKDLFVWVQQISEKKFRYTYFRRIVDE